MMEMKSTNSDPVTTDVMEVKEDIAAGIKEYLGILPGMADRKEYLFFLYASILFSLGILLALGYIFVWPLLQPYYDYITDREKIINVCRAAGNWAPIVYMLLEAGQTLSIFWPVPFEIAGGYLFGVTLGMIYSTLGLTFGGILAFLLGRWLEKTYLRRIFKPNKLQRFRKLMEREGALAAFIIYLIPGVPKDFVSYLLGFTSLSLKFFVVASTIFRLPSTFLLILQGSEAAHGHYWLSISLMVINYILAILMYRYREYLYQWIEACCWEEA